MGAKNRNKTKSEENRAQKNDSPIEPKTQQKSISEATDDELASLATAHDWQYYKRRNKSEIYDDKTMTYFWWVGTKNTKNTSFNSFQIFI